MKKAFTLIELVISIVILSIMMLFLYKSYSSLNRSNRVLLEETQLIAKKELLKKTLYLDFSLAMGSTIINQSKTEDVVMLKTVNSVHKRIHPYVAYIFKDKKLYRLEALRPIQEYPLTVDSEFDVDELGSAEIFRVYRSKDSKTPALFVHILFEDKDEILLKINQLNIINKAPAKLKNK